MEFEDIFNEYFRDVFHFALGIAKDRGTAEEIAQETFMRALKRLKDYDGVCDLRSWLFTIARNIWYDMCRRRKFTQELPEGFEPAEPTALSERLADADTAFEIHRFIHDMPEPYKEVFNLRIFGELPYERIGMIFGKSAGWARVIFYRAKRMIQEHMEGVGLERE